MKRKLNRQIKSSVVEPVINLTPLIDVVFVILIVFMLVAPLLEMEKIDLSPGSEASKEQVTVREKSALAIYVRKDNTIWLNKENVTIEQLIFFLKQARSKGGDQTPQLFHDREAYFGTYQKVKEAVEIAGFDQIDVVLKPS